MDSLERGQWFPSYRDLIVSHTQGLDCVDTAQWCSLILRLFRCEYILWRKDVARFSRDWLIDLKNSLVLEVSTYRTALVADGAMNAELAISSNTSHVAAYYDLKFRQANIIASYCLAATGTNQDTRNASELVAWSRTKSRTV